MSFFFLKANNGSVDTNFSGDFFSLIHTKCKHYTKVYRTAAMEVFKHSLQ